MRISFVVPRCTTDNSHGRYVIELANRFSSDHVVSVFSGTFSAPLSLQVQCYKLPVPNRPAVARLGFMWAASFIATRRSHSEIIHVNGADAPIGNIVTAQCCNAIMRNAGHNPGTYRRFNFALGVWAERYTMSKRTTRRVIAISRKVEGEIEREYGVDPKKIAVVYHGVDLEVFNPKNQLASRGAVRQRLGVLPDEFLVLYVGGDYRLKGLEPLLGAAARVGGNIKVVAVGINPDTDLKKLIVDNGYDELVQLLGNTSEIASLYAAADCFVLPTRYDTFSLVTLEAMASGLPVIVSSQAGIAELLKSGHDCLVLQDPLDVDSLSQQLTRLIRDEGLRRALGTEARRTAERHSWDTVAEQTMLVYREALDNC